MNQKTIAICDDEEDYAYALMSYFNEMKNLLFRAQAFTSGEVLRAYLEKNHLDVLLVSASYLQKQNIKNVDCLIVLSEGEANQSLASYPHLYKYQAAKQLFHEALLIYAESMGEVLTQMKGSTEIIGIYSPLKRVNKTKFSLALGQLLAAKKKTLLLNLEEYSGFSVLLKQNYKKDFSDLIYYYRQKNMNFAIRMEEIEQRVGDLTLIPPIQCAADLWDITKEDMLGVLSELKKVSRYEVIIIDFGNGVSGLFDLLAQCKTVYMPVLNDAISVAKVQEFEAQIQRRSNETTSFQVIPIRLPQEDTMPGKEFRTEELLWGEFGDVVRSLGF